MSAAKNKAKKEENEKGLSNFSINKIIPEKYQTLALFLIIFGIFMIYYSPMYFGDKTFESGDIVTVKSIRTFLENDREDYTLWYPYIFCGMPAYTLAVDYKWFNLIYVGFKAVRDVFTSFFANEYSMWTMFLLILAFTSYFLTTYLTKNRLIGIFVGLANAFSTGIIVFLFIGHVTKLTSLCFFPLILLILLKFQEKIKLRDFAILVIALQLSVQGWHVQIIFYMMMAVSIYFLYNLIFTIAQKEKEKTIQYLKSMGVFAASMMIALAIQSDNLTQIYEYNPYSTRGTKGILEQQSGVKQQSESDFYQYATNWSFSPGEVMTFIIPSYFGFGNSTYKGPLSGGKEVKVNTYFGQMPFVDVAMYMGVVIFFLALFSIYVNRKNRFVQFLAVLSGIALIISFGRTFPVAYDLMFNYFPFFDKFRVPSMILVLIQLSFPILAGLGLHKIISLRNEKNIELTNVIKYIAYGFTILFAITLVMNSAITGWFAGRVSDYAAMIQSSQPRDAQQFIALAGYMSNMFTTDLYIALAFSASTFWLAFLYIKSKLGGDLFVIAVIVLVMIDLIRIDNRGARYSEAADEINQFNQPEYVRVIKSQQDTEPFRMLNLKQDGSLGSLNRNSNYNSYFLLQDFYGYSAVKPRTYQDYVDVVGLYNITMWRMLNIKYIVTNKQQDLEGFNLVRETGSSRVYENPYVLSRAYFVDSLKVSTPMEILTAVKENTFDPKRVAFIEHEGVTIDKPDSTASVVVTTYKDEKIEINATASGNNLLFLGDTYFPKGWAAYIDGEETQIYKINHGFRGIIVPEGNHKITFVYLPISFVISKYAVLVLSTLTIIGLILGIYFENKKNKNVETVKA